MRHFSAIGIRAMRPENDVDWQALLFGAQSLADDPLPDDLVAILDACPGCGSVLCEDMACETEPYCETCAGTGVLTRTAALGHIERKPCPECQGGW